MNAATPRSANSILAVLFFGVLMAALDIAIVGPALPALRTHFGVNERAISWVFTIYVLFNLTSTPIMAKLSDRLGRRLVYTCDVALFAVGSLIVATSHSFEQLLFGRAVQALGAGGIFPVASAVIGDTIAPERRGRALGLIGAVFGVAFLLGPFLAALLLRFGWQWLFLINLPIALALMIASWRVLPATAQAVPPPFDWGGAITISVALSGLAIGLGNIDAHRLASLAEHSVWPFLLTGIAAAVVAVLVERRAADPVLRPSWFASRQMKLVVIFAAGAGLGEAAMVFLPELAVSALGMSPQASSFMLLPVVLALAIGSPLLGRALDRSGAKPIIVIALISLTAGAATIGLAPTTLTILVTGGILVGLGLSGLLGAPLRYVLLEEIAASERGAAQGLLTVFVSIGQLLSAATIGAVAASAGGGASGYRESFAVMSAVVGVMALLSLALRSRQRR